MAHRFQESERISSGGRRIAREIGRRTIFILDRRGAPAIDRIVQVADLVDRLYALLVLIRPGVHPKCDVHREMQDLEAVRCQLRQLSVKRKVSLLPPEEIETLLSLPSDDSHADLIQEVRHLARSIPEFSGDDLVVRKLRMIVSRILRRLQEWRFQVTDRSVLFTGRDMSIRILREALEVWLEDCRSDAFFSWHAAHSLLECQEQIMSKISIPMARFPSEALEQVHEFQLELLKLTGLAEQVATVAKPGKAPHFRALFDIVEQERSVAAETMANVGRDFLRDLNDFNRPRIISPSFPCQSA